MDKIGFQLIIIGIFGIILGGFAKSISIGFKIDFVSCLFTCWISGLIGSVGGFLIGYFN
jgi:hypothetical protein